MSYRQQLIVINDGFYGKEVTFMSEREKQIIETFSLIIPKLSESDKSYLLGLGEGMAIKVNAQDKKTATA